MAQSLLKKQEKTTSKESSAKSTPPKKGGFAENEIKSGFLVTISFITLIALLFISGKAQLFAPVVKRDIQFAYIGGLAKNSPVHYAGHKIGKVTDIRFNGSADAPVSVTISIQNDINVREDSLVYIDSLGFMGEKFLEITAGTPDSPIVPLESAVRGIDPMPMMELMKKGNELLAEFEKTNEHLDTLLTNVGDVVGDNKEVIGDTFVNLEASSENLKEMTSDLKKHPWKLLRKSEGKKKKFLII